MPSYNIGGLDTYTKLLLHCNGADASTTFTDEAGHTMTANGNAQIDTAISAFGGASGLFDAIDDSVSAINSTDWNLGSGDFVVEARVYPAKDDIDNHMGVVAHYNSTTSNREWMLALLLGDHPSGKSLAFNYSTDGIAFTSVIRAWNYTVNTWYHIAAARASNTLRLYIDGVKQGADVDLTGVTFYVGTYVLTIGQGALATSTQNRFKGNIDEVRISKGTARGWTGATFDVPTKQYNNYLDFGARLRKGSTNYAILGQTLSTQPLRICDGSTTYGVPLLATTDEFAGTKRIYHGSVKAAAMESI